MSGLIPQITIAVFKNLKAEQIKKLKSAEITSNGEVLFYAIIPPEEGGTTITDVIKTEAEHLAFRANTIGGKELADVRV